MPVHAKAPPHALEAQATILESDAGKLPEAEAIEPAFAAKPREAGLATRAYSAKKAAIGLVETLQSSALKVCRRLRSLRISVSPKGKALGLIEIGNCYPSLPVGSNALFEGGVVELPLRLKDLLEDPVLSLRGEEPKTKGTNHGATIPTHKLTR